MIKAEIVKEIATKTGVDSVAVLVTIESFMKEIQISLSKGENVYLRGFGSFIVKHRAEKTGRNISKKTTVVIPAHKIPKFKPCDSFVNDVKTNVKI